MSVPLFAPLHHKEALVKDASPVQVRTSHQQPLPWGPEVCEHMGVSRVASGCTHLLLTSAGGAGALTASAPALFSPHQPLYHQTHVHEHTHHFSCSVENGNWGHGRGISIWSFASLITGGWGKAKTPLKPHKLPFLTSPASWWLNDYHEWSSRAWPWGTWALEEDWDLSPGSATS